MSPEGNDPSANGGEKPMLNSRIPRPDININLLHNWPLILQYIEAATLYYNIMDILESSRSINGIRPTLLISLLEFIGGR